MKKSTWAENFKKACNFESMFHVQEGTIKSRLFSSAWQYFWFALCTLARFSKSRMDYKQGTHRIYIEVVGVNGRQLYSLAQNFDTRDRVFQVIPGVNELQGEVCGLGSFLKKTSQANNR